MNFTSKDHEYHKDELGIHQLNPQPFTYDQNYVHTYDTDSYRRGNDILQALRLGFVIGSHGSVPYSICDVGFGNGAFLQRCRGIIPKLYGKDVSNVELDFIIRVYDYIKCDIITFWDCLEHIKDLSFLANLECETVCISLPWCHFEDFTDISSAIEWFEDWKHHKPDEHLHYFNERNLNRLMNKYGWFMVTQSYHEDIVRVTANGQHNILSMAFKRV